MLGTITCFKSSVSIKFLSFSKAIQHENGLTYFSIPSKDKGMNYRYTGVGPFPMVALHRYSLKMHLAKFGSPFAPILSALTRSGYEGWVSTEPFDYKPDPSTVARTALNTLREATGT